MIYFQKIWKTNYQTICPKFEKGGFDSKECDLAAKLAYFGLLANSPSTLVVDIAEI